AAAPCALDTSRRDLGAQPVAGESEDLDMVGRAPELFLQLPLHRLLGRFAGIDPPLRKLPRVLADPLAPKDQILRVRDDNGDARAIPLTVQHRDTCSSARCGYSCIVRRGWKARPGVDGALRRQRRDSSRGV